MKPAMKPVVTSLSSARKRCSGFAMPTAIFLVVILAGLGSFMMNFSTNANITSMQDVQGTRVYWAARSGVQWAVSSILYAGNCTGSPTSLSDPTLTGFALNINCTSDAHDENGVTRTIWHVTAKANSTGAAGSLGYVERQLSATVER